MAQYRALVGIDYPPNKRAEAGEIVSDLPGDAIKWLQEEGLIEDASKPAKKVETPVVEETPVVAEVIAEPVAEVTEEASEEGEAE
jgi:hypothetical protein